MFQYYALIGQLVAILLLVYYYFSKKYTYWSSKGVPGPKPLPPFGNLIRRVRKSPTKFELELLEEYGKVYGLYYGVEPVLTIVDHELIKQVMIKDFHLLINHRTLRVYHDVWNQNLFFLEDENWKRVRSITTPSFTSGKLRAMYPVMLSCVDRLDQYLSRMAENGDSGSIINAREVFAGFTIDVIASAAFGTQTNANDDRTESNAFVQHGIKLFKANPMLVVAMLCLPRKINDLLKIQHIFPQKSFKFFLDLATQIVKQRKNSTNKRADLIQLMVDAYVYENELDSDDYSKLAASVEMDASDDQSQKSGSVKKSLTEKEIIAQCILFFIAGFETTSTTLTYSIYELVKNEQIQQRLYQEIQQVEMVPGESESQYAEKLLTQVPYLDAVVKETLRMYPPVTRLERRVGVDGYKLNGITLEKDQVIEISSYAVHHCEEYYPEPHKFNPDRFMPENKHLLTPYTYLPFGIGPRNCVGMRFAYQEIKLGLARIISKYQFQMDATTPKELHFRAGQVMLNAPAVPVQIMTRN